MSKSVRTEGSSAWLLASLWLLLCLSPLAALAQVAELDRAERSTLDGRTEVTLPDVLRAPAGATPPLRATYRMSLRIDARPQRLAICMPGLIAHARIRFNGHVVDDRLSEPVGPLPRGYKRIRLIEVPEEFVHMGENILEIEAAGRSVLSISRINVGSIDALQHRYEKRILAGVVGPAFVAVMVGSLGLCVLLLWARTGDALYGYFALGTLGLALHNAWSLLPVSLLEGVHFSVWWTSLYSFYVAMLVIFCMRFAGWQWRRFDRALSTLALSAPLLLYAAYLAGQLDFVAQAWLLGWIAVVGVGLVAVSRYAWLHRSTETVLLTLAGGLSLSFGARDWLLNFQGGDNNPIYLVPYAGLMFVVLVAWMLIDRFVDASRAVEAINADLEQRVGVKSAQLTQTLEQMRLARDGAEAANRAKSSFLAAASHDLRQPIHALGLYMAALDGDRLRTEQQDLVQRMRSSLSALTTMFNALLDVSRMDAGAVAVRRRVFALAPLLHRVAQEFATLATEKGLRLSVRIGLAPPDLHAYSDPVLVERVVRNLLSNAVKYSDRGGVLLSARLRGGCWHLEIWDTGAGIAEADRERVYEEFYQVGNPERDRAGGLGLGLSIVRRLTDLLGHHLELRSEPGRGTRFALHLPCAPWRLPEPASAFDVPAGHGERLTLALAVVDDDPEVRDSMTTLLQRWGCRVYAGADVEEVLRAVGAAPGDVLQAIVADYRLRGTRTGVDAIHALRAVCGRRLPALIVSGDSGPDRLAQMQASGFDCMSKPVTPSRLRGWLVGAAGMVSALHEEALP